MKNDRKRKIFSIPNLMSFARLLLIPVFCWLYLKAESDREFLWAFLVVLLSSLTDLLDGWVARRFDMITDLGKVLDPLADKLTHGALAVCLAVRYPFMWALIVLMLLKEGFMGIMGVIFLRQGRMLDGAMWFGKVCTAVLFLGLLVLTLFPHLPARTVNGLILMMMAVMAFTLCKYISFYRKLWRGETKEGVMQL